MIADFEGSDYGEWKTIGDAFGDKPTETKGRVVGHQGRQLVDTFISAGGDNPIGTLTSPSFTIDRKRINFLIGGGKTPKKTCANLLVDGKTVRTAVGNATKDANKKKVMRWVSWDVSDLIGKTAQITIVDESTGGWGHIMVDHIFQSNRSIRDIPKQPATEPKPLSRKLSDQKPNIILILADDQGWNALLTQMDPNEPGSGSTYYQTPRLAKLAAQGMRFSQAYSPAPTCSPTRHSIQFGRSPGSLKIFGADDIRNIDATDRESLANVLESIHPDYACADLGKWHIGPSPNALDYDVSDGNTCNGTGNSKEPNDPKLVFDLSKRANEFMEQQVQAGKTFYLQISHYANHLKYQAREETIKKYETEHADKVTQYQNSPLWAAMNENLDTGVGMILDKIDELEITDNTYVIYTDDNGYESKKDFNKPVHDRGYYKAFPQRSHKYHVSEGGIRVPFIVLGPGITPNTHSSVPVVGTDVFATVMDISGGHDQIPSRVEGASLLDHLRSSGNDPVDRKDPFLVFKHSKPAIPHDIAIVQGNYKMIKDIDTGKMFLFNLKKDIGESHDLTDE